jgi:hypothetical protein
MTKFFLISASIVTIVMFATTPVRAWGENKDGSGGYGHTPGTTQPPAPERLPPTRPETHVPQSTGGYGGQSDEGRPARHPYYPAEHYPTPEGGRIIIVGPRPTGDYDDDYRPRRHDDDRDYGDRPHHHDDDRDYGDRPRRHDDDRASYGERERPRGDWGGYGGR